MSKAQVTDILLLAFISGVVAILTSMMGINGTIIGAVVTSIIAESLKTYFKEPLKEKVNEREKRNERSYRQKSNVGFETIDESFDNETIHSIKESYYPRPKNSKVRRKDSSDGSFLSAKILFIFPLMVILIIELIHFLGAIGIIPYDIFYSLESITNWRLFRTIGFALIIMGIYPIISKKFSTSSGVILIIIGIIELIFGYADVNVHAMTIVSVISSLREIVNIGIILAILYTILTISEEKVDDRKRHKFLE
ncbi:MAG: hypothetical protein BZ138_01665 [Methanosphaera sp. rholeuAM270]|nr:MAG: hypothetical protein BZ138_01665 [Methanosphaera sp. rholeuAM270]